MNISETTIKFQVWEWANYYVISGPRGIGIYVLKDGTVSYEKSMIGVDGKRTHEFGWCYENTLGHWANEAEAEAFLREWNKHHRVVRTDSIELIG